MSFVPDDSNPENKVNQKVNPDRPHSFRLVELATCMDPNGNVKRCAVEPKDCQGDGESFWGHNQDSSVIRKCNPNNVKVGRCLKENTCAVTETDCAMDISSANFDRDDGSCTYQRDKSQAWNVEDPAFTQFGSCLRGDDDYFCIYEASECDVDNGEVYRTPAETNAAGVSCDCGAVHVYACYHPGGPIVCSVKGNGCRGDYGPLSPHWLRELRETKQNNLDCRLCARTNTPAPTPRPTTKTRRPTKGPTQSPVRSLTPTTGAPTMIPTVTLVTAENKGDPNALIPSSSRKEDGGDGDGAMIGLIVGGTAAAVVLVAALALVYYRALFRPKSYYKKKTKGKNDSSLPGEISLGTLDDIYD